MTPEETTGIKIVAAAFGFVVFLILAWLVWVFGPAIVDRLTDDGHRAYPPSHWVKRR
jgi:hypothetical protein